ncbi:MAG: arylamine N-acetyltransferase [Chloroflexi bacterium]|nr:MAG: arylamine N-acetyltransferase [Chloroflexota bacterium]
MIHIDRYFERIRYRGPREPSLETLRGLHRAHLFAVPFENLDIHLGRRIVLDESRLFEKLVTQRRGGFCYEQNGLFAAVLGALGFEVTLLEARVGRGDGTFGIPFDHLTLMVQLDDRWLVDVGFGDSFLEPLRLDDPGDQTRDEGVFRVAYDGARGVYARHAEGEWRDQYEFYLAPRLLVDFAGGCHYHQTSPLTTFTQRRVCSLATPEGRVTLSDLKLITTRNGQRDERTLPDEAAFQAALRTYFDIDLP